MTSRNPNLDGDAQSLSSVSAVSLSFCSATDGSYHSDNYEIESEVGRDALIQICCCSLSRLLDFPDSQLEVLLGSDEDLVSSGENDSETNVARFV